MDELIAAMEIQMNLFQALARLMEVAAQGVMVTEAVMERMMKAIEQHEMIVAHLIRDNLVVVQ